MRRGLNGMIAEVSALGNVERLVRCHCDCAVAQNNKDWRVGPATRRYEL